MSHVDVDVDVDVDEKVCRSTEAVNVVSSQHQWRPFPAFGGGTLSSHQLFNPNFFINIGSVSAPGVPALPTQLSSFPSTHEPESPTSDPSPTMPTITPLPSALQPTLPITKNLKLLVLGNAKCGKSSLIHRYCYGTFSERYKTTIGADFIRKDVSYKSDRDPAAIGVRLQLWDIAGQDRFQKLTRAYFSKARGVVIVCDLNRDGTIEAVRQWKREVTDWAARSGRPDLPIILLANKCDMMDQKTDSQAAFKMGVLMERLCREEKFLAWFLTSARSGEGVDRGFNALIDAIMQEHTPPRLKEASASCPAQATPARTFKLSTASSKEADGGPWGCY